MLQGDEGTARIADHFGVEPPDPDQLGRFGVVPVDDLPHRWDPDEPSWNESWFFDWFEAEPRAEGSDSLAAAVPRAGHCRIGWMPVQRRVWIWIYVLEVVEGRPEWCYAEHPFLDAAHFRTPEVGWSRPGLDVRFASRDPLRSGRLEVRTQARVVTGPRAGDVRPLAVTLDYLTVGAPHSTGQGSVPGHMSEGYDARRYEQAIVGEVRFGDDGSPFFVRGERDHSWGPRSWDLEWTFLALSSRERRVQCVEVRFPDPSGTIEPIRIGYLSTGGSTEDLDSIDLAVVCPESLEAPYSGSVAVEAAGRRLGGTIEHVTAHAMDLSHVLSPPRPTTYRRALVRLLPDDEGEPLTGWVEDHRLR